MVACLFSGGIVEVTQLIPPERTVVVFQVLQFRNKL